MSDLVTKRIADPSYIGGAEMVAIAGKSKYLSAHDVWAIKRGYAESPEVGEAAQWGMILQGPVLKEYGRRVEATDLVEMFDELRRHPDRPWQGGHPDGDRPEVKIVPEVKTVGYRRSEEFGEEWSDDVPDDILIQATWYTSLMQRDAADVIVLLGGQTLKIFRIPLCKPLEARLLEISYEFFTKHLVADVPPDRTPTTDAFKGYLKKQFPADVEPLREAAEAETEVAIALSTAYGMETLWHAKADELENKLRVMIGTASGIEGEDFRATWKKSKDGNKTDWKGLAAHYATTLQMIGSSKKMAGRLFHAAALAALDGRLKFETPKEGPRKLLTSGRLFKGTEATE